MSLTFPALSKGTDARHLNPSSAVTTLREPGGAEAMALLIAAQGSPPVEVVEFEERLEFEVDEAALLAASETKSTPAWVMTSSMSRSG